MGVTLMANDKTIDIECTHHWKLEQPKWVLGSGLLSYGTCKKCGAGRQFTGENKKGRAPEPTANDQSSDSSTG